jgi:hypothetical protein
MAVFESPFMLFDLSSTPVSPLRKRQVRLGNDYPSHGMSEGSLIINADDFGLKHEVNLAIVRAIEMGWCSSCSIRPNMPGFQEACELAHTYCLAQHLGLHLTLTEGNSISEPISRCPLFCDAHGRFRHTRKQRLFRLKSNEGRAWKKKSRLKLLYAKNRDC